MLFALIATAIAASNEADVELGWTGAPSPSFDRISDSDFLGSYGLRGGLKVHHNIAIVGGWHHARTGATVSSDDQSNLGPEGGFRASFTGELFSLGAKGDVSLGSHFTPYVVAQAALQVGTMRIDDDASTDENIGQLVQGGIAPGIIGAVGAELPFRLGDGPVAIAPYLELGYTWLAPMALDELGSLRLGGFSGRTGVGLRF